MGEIGAALAAFCGAALSLVGTGLYLRDIRRGLTTPHRGSWLVWGVISVLAALSHRAEGGGWSLLVLGGQALATLLVLACAVRRGVGRLTVENVVMLAVASFGLVGWMLFTDPIAATACAAMADGAGLLATAPKAWADPNSETLATYALAGATGLLAALGVEAGDVALLLFPVYFCLGNSATAILIALRRRAVSAVPAGSAASAAPAASAASALSPGAFVLAARRYGTVPPVPRHCRNLPAW